MDKISIYDGSCKSTLRGAFTFECKSALGRKFLTQHLRCSDEKKFKYCHLGAGKNLISGADWVNADFFIFNKKKRPTEHNYWMVDLRYKLPCEDSYFKGIVTEHTLEHLYPDEVKQILEETYRVLEVGGSIRIVLPDLDKYIQHYNGNYNHVNFDRFSSPAAAIRNLTQAYFHHSCWTADMLSNLMREIGFSELKEVSWDKSRDPALLINFEKRAWESFYVEAAKL